MKRRTGVGLLLVAALALLGGGPRAGVRAESAIEAATELAPDPEIQDGIRRVARAERPEDLAVALDALRRESEPDFSDLVPQLALFLLGAKGER
jgi:hypothetical protein